MSNLNKALALLQELLDEYTDTVDGKCEWEARDEEFVIRTDEFLRKHGKQGVKDK